MRRPSLTTHLEATQHIAVCTQTYQHSWEQLVLSTSLKRMFSRCRGAGPTLDKEEDAEPTTRSPKRSIGAQKPNKAPPNRAKPQTPDISRQPSQQSSFPHTPQPCLHCYQKFFFQPCPSTPLSTRTTYGLLQSSTVQLVTMLQAASGCFRLLQAASGALLWEILNILNGIVFPARPGRRCPRLSSRRRAATSRLTPAQVPSPSNCSRA